MCKALVQIDDSSNTYSLSHRMAAFFKFILEADYNGIPIRQLIESDTPLQMTLHFGAEPADIVADMLLKARPKK